MRDIHHDSQPVAFGNNFPSEFAQAFILWIAPVSRGIADIIIAGVTERNVADSSVIIFFYERKIFSDGITIFHPDECCSFPFFFQSISILRGCRQLYKLRIILAHLMDGV